MVRKNESGITLVELLAALVLVTIVTAIIWNTLFGSMRHNATETTKLRLQQEANYVITEIQRYHRQCGKYNLTIQEEIKIGSCDPESLDGLPDLIVSEGFIYEANDISVSFGTSFDEFSDTTIESKGNDSTFSMDLTIKDSKNKKLFVTIPTTISRYNGNQ